MITESSDISISTICVRIPQFNYWVGSPFISWHIKTIIYSISLCQNWGERRCFYNISRIGTKLNYMLYLHYGKLLSWERNKSSYSFSIHIFYGFETPFELIDSITICYTKELFIKVSSKHGHIHKDTNIHTRTYTITHCLCNTIWLHSSNGKRMKKATLFSCSEEWLYYFLMIRKDCCGI